jgi:hypothetical protein
MREADNLPPYSADVKKSGLAWPVMDVLYLFFIGVLYNHMHLTVTQQDT